MPRTATNRLSGQEEFLFVTENSFSQNHNLYAGAGVAEWLSRQPRDQMMGSQIRKRQDSWWASCSQGFESLPRRHQHTLVLFSGKNFAIFSSKRCLSVHGKGGRTQQDFSECCCSSHKLFGTLARCPICQLAGFESFF